MMELTPQEQMLIRAVREMDEVPYNILLWYIAGLEGSSEKLSNAGLYDKYRMEVDKRRIDVARSYMKDM